MSASDKPSPARIKRLAILALPGLDHFIMDLARALAKTRQIDIRCFACVNETILADALAWVGDTDSGAVWFEFCWPPFPSFIAAADFGHRRVIVRVHRIEVYEAPYVAQTNWAKVSDLIVVSHDMARCVRQACAAIDTTTRLHVIYNGIDLDHYQARQSMDPYRIGWCGNIILRKNPLMALQILHALRRDDHRYRLHMAGNPADRLTIEAVHYLRQRLDLGDAMVMEGKITADAMPAWHGQNGILLSTSVHESFGMAIAEAAAVGCDIAVMDHVGADEFWPETVRFTTTDQAVTLIKAAQSNRWHNLVAQNFSLMLQVEKTLEIL